jgi:hypothetical protein
MCELLSIRARDFNHYRKPSQVASLNVCSVRVLLRDTLNLIGRATRVTFSLYVHHRRTRDA